MSDYPPPPPPENPPENPSDQGWGQQPPPPPAWGQQPPPPPPYGAPPGAGGYSLGAALNYGWTKFVANLGPFLLIGLIWGGASILFNLVGRFAAYGAVSPGPGDDAFSLVSTLFSILGFVVSTFLGAAGTRGALDVVEGRQVTLGGMFERWDKVQVLVTALLVTVFSLLGLLALCVGILVVVFLTWYSTFFVVGAGMAAMDGIKASFNFTKDNVGELLPLALVNFLILLVGACFCGVGLLVAYPVTVLASAYAFRSLHGQPVAP